MQSIDYKRCWNARATTTAQALMAVDGRRDAALRTTLDATATHIRHPPRWTGLSNCILDAEFRSEPLHSALNTLRHCALDDPLARMFRAWIHGAWMQSAADWGAPPDQLEQGVNA